MTSILNYNNVKVQKKKNSFLIQISKTNEKKNKTLFNSLVESKNINTISLNKCSKTNICSLEFKAHYTNTLKNLLSNNNYLDYLDLISLFSCIKKQIDFLFENNIGILLFNINDIIAIKHNKNDKAHTFLFVNSNYLFDIDNNNLVVTSSFDKRNKDIFISPELVTLNSIPFQIPYKSCFFSFSLLVSFCIEGKKIDFLNPISWNVDDFINILEPIDNTKLFWALLRCQEKDPNDRFLLLI